MARLIPTLFLICLLMLIAGSCSRGGFRAISPESHKEVKAVSPENTDSEVFSPESEGGHAKEDSPGEVRSSGENQVSAGSQEGSVSYAPADQSLRVLSNREYAGVVRSVFNKEISLPLLYDGGKTFDNQILNISKIKVEKYLEAADLLASSLSFAEIPGAICQTSETKCLEDFIGSFSKRVWHRKIQKEEASSLLAYATERLSAGGYEETILELVRVFFSSPRFIIRTEYGRAGSGNQALTDYELAHFLSLFFWGEAPDQILLDLADKELLKEPAEVGRQMNRLLSDERKGDYVFRVFIDQMLQLKRLDSADLPLPSGLNREDVIRALKQDSVDFFLEALNRPEDQFRSLWLSTGPEVPTILQALSPDGAGERQGLLARMAFLAVNAHGTESNPIKRGVRVLEAFLCRELPPPPPEATEAVSQGLNTREFRAANPKCSGCHQQIDGVGYGFEQFNGLGIFDPSKNGAGTLFIDGDKLNFGGLSETGGLSGLFAESEEARTCLVKNWVTFAMGPDIRPETRQALTRELSEKLSESGSVRDIVKNLVTSKIFLQRN